MRTCVPAGEAAGPENPKSPNCLQVEKLLAEISAMEEGGARPGSARTGGASSGAAADLDARVRMFERLASEIARLNFYATRGKVPSL